MRVPPVERRWGGPFNLLASDLWPGPDTTGQSIFILRSGYHRTAPESFVESEAILRCGWG
jgi:hypothetical protein